MKPEDVPDDLMNGGREALVRWLRDHPLHLVPTFEAKVRVVLAAAWPEIERQVRAKVADEIEAYADEHADGSSWDGGIGCAIKIARGEQP